MYQTNTKAWASYQIRKIAGCACAGNAGKIFPTADFKGNRSFAIPAYITARASRTWRDAFRDRLPVVAGKTFPSFPAHAHPQFYVSGKRSMDRVPDALGLLYWEKLEKCKNACFACAYPAPVPVQLQVCNFSHFAGVISLSERELGVIIIMHNYITPSVCVLIKISYFTVNNVLVKIMGNYIYCMIAGVFCGCRKNMIKNMGCNLI